MSVESKVKKLVSGVLFILGSASVYAVSLKFDVLYDTSFKYVCTANSLKIVSTQINVDGFVSCEAGSSADFTKPNSQPSVKSLSVTMKDPVTLIDKVNNFSVSKVYGGVDADGFITQPSSGNIQLALGPVDDPVTEPIDIKNLKIIEPHANGYTHLPGCIGLTTTDPSLCRTSGSIGNEVYAVRLDTSSFTDMYQNQVFSVRGITHDDMDTVDNIFRAFIMAISTTAGDFSPTDEACKETVGSGVLKLNVMQVQANPNFITDLEKAAKDAVNLALSNPSNIGLLNEANNKILQVKAAQKNLQSSQDGSVCILDKTKNYYVNVRPVNPGCQAYVNGKLTSPNGDGGCRIEVLTEFPVPSK